MGAEYQERMFQGSLTKHELTEEFHFMAQAAAYEYGHGPYTGSWGEKLSDGVRIIDKTFSSRIEAETYVAENADKWGMVPGD